MYYSDGASMTRHTCPDCGCDVLADSWQRHREWHGEPRRGRVMIRFTRIEVECESLDDAARVLSGATKLLR